MSKILYEVYQNDIKDSESVMFGKWYARLKGSLYPSPRHRPVARHAGSIRSGSGGGGQNLGAPRAGRQNSSVTSSGMVTIDTRVVINVTSVIIVVSLPYFRQRMVP